MECKKKVSFRLIKGGSMFETIAYRIKLDMSYEAALEGLTRILLEEGFSVMTNLELRNATGLVLDQGKQRFSILSLGDPAMSIQATQLGQAILPVNITIEEDAQGSVICIGKLETELVQGLVSSKGDIKDLSMTTLKRLELVADSLRLSSELSKIESV
jgi:uncharacterized protein (DUF302 family)